MIAGAGVTRTDYGVALECGVFTWLFHRRDPPEPTPHGGSGVKPIGVNAKFSPRCERVAHRLPGLAAPRSSPGIALAGPIVVSLCGVVTGGRADLETIILPIRDGVSVSLKLR